MLNETFLGGGGGRPRLFALSLLTKILMNRLKHDFFGGGFLLFWP
jgi:hypothetical protein